MRQALRVLLAPTLVLLLAVGAAACGGPGESDVSTETGEPAAGEPESPDEVPAGETGPVDEEPAEEVVAAEAEAELEPADEGVPPLYDPDSPEMNRRAPDRYRVRFETTAGDFLVEVHRDWAPRGADRFYNLVSQGFYDDNYFFRAVDDFVVQFGIPGDPQLAAVWSDATIRDDPVEEMNTRGRVVFATSGPDTRTTQLFINTGDNLHLDTSGFAPFGEVVEGMEVVRDLYSGYGDGPPSGSGPDQARIRQEGNEYLEEEFPELDKIEDVTVVSEG